MVLFIPSAEKKPYQIHPVVEIFNTKINKKLVIQIQIKNLGRYGTL